MSSPRRATVVVIFSLLVGACASEDYWPTEVPNYDHLVGKKYVEVISPVAQRGFKKTQENSEYEEVEDKRPDGCSTIFGVRKADGVIAYWRVLANSDACKVSRKAFNT